MSINSNSSKKLGINIKLERVKRGWTQDKLAELADVNKNTISSIERGSWSTSIDTLAKIADAFGMTISKLTDLSNVEI